MLSNSYNNNLLFGQLQDNEYFLESTIGMQFLDNQILIRDSNGIEVIRFFLDSGLLKYQVTVNGILLPSQSLTDPNIVSENDSLQLPHTSSNTRLDLANDTYRLFLQNVLRQSQNGDNVYIKANNVQCENGISNIVFRFQLGSQQKIQILNSDTMTVIFELSDALIDVKSKSIIGITQSNDLTSAVNLQQLLNSRPKYLQTSGISNNIQIQNQLEQNLIVITNNSLISDIPLQYNIRPLTFDLQTIPDCLQVQNILGNYQNISQKNSQNGYLGLNSSTKIEAQFQTPSVVNLQNSQLTTFANQQITTDNIQEGIQKLYLTSSRVNSLIQAQKGQSNGLCPLNSSFKIPSEYLDTVQTGNIFSGIDNQKTNSANPSYSQGTPVKGDQYISTDSSHIYILSTTPFTTNGNWVQIIFPGVNSVNGQSGSVSLSSDNMPEGIVNKYFDSGMTDYIQNNTNTQNQLLKLNGSGYINPQQLNPQFVLNGGVISINDDQISSLTFKNNFNQDPLFRIATNQLLAYKPFTYAITPQIININDIPNKQYVDTQIQQYFPNKLQYQQSKFELQSDKGILQINGFQVNEISETQMKTNIPIILDSSIQFTNVDQVVTKQYVDNVLSNFVSGSGVNKEYISIKSTQSINSSQKVISWITQLQSETSSRIVKNVNDTFTLQSGQYRFYMSIQINEFTEQELVDVNIQLRNSQTLQVYQQFPNKLSSLGGNQVISLSYPFTYQLQQQTTLEVYIQVQDNVYGVYNTDLFIEELQKVQASIGQDRLTDSTVVSKLQITDQELDIKINNVQYGKFRDNQLTMEPSIKIQYDQSTSISNPQELVTKQYVDTEINLATTSISNIGQLIHIQLTSDQVSGIQSGGTVFFNSVLTTTSITTSVDSLGVFTFLPGFIYRVFYTISCRFLSNIGFCQFVCKNTLTSQIVSGSYVYILMTANSNDTQLGSQMFYIDLRSAQTSQSFKFTILSQQNLQQIYKQFSGCCIEQVQQISDQLFDRIQNVDMTSQIKIYNQQLELKLNNQLLTKIQNISGDITYNQQIDNTNIVIKSTQNSTNLSEQLLLQNAGTVYQRQAQFIVNVNNSLQTIVRARITDGSNGNKKIVEFGGVGGQQLNLFTSDFANPQLQIFDDSESNILKVVVNKKMGYSSNQAITENYQFPSKQYVDTLNLFPVGGILIWYTSVVPPNFLLCNGQAFSQLTYPSLFTVLGTAVLPDFRGYFLRGLETSATPVVETTVNRTLGSIQLDQNKAHTHTVQDQYNNTRNDRVYGFFDGGRTFAYDSYGQRTVTSSSNGGSEARPKNISVNFIMRAI